MDSEKEVVLKLYKQGATIKGLTDMIYSQIKAKKDERVRIRLEDVRNMVEQTIYEGCFRKADY